MPLLLLIVLALAAGLGAGLLARSLLGRHPGIHQLKLALGATIGGAAVLAVHAVTVRATDALRGLDESVAEWGNRHASSFAHDGLTLVTTLGETWAVVVVGALVVAVDLLRRRSLWALPFLLAAIAGDKLITALLKDLIDRARPDLEPIAATLGPSFPSGHSSTAAAAWAAFALVASRWVDRRWWPTLAGLAVGLAVAVALSRVLLDVHWLTDVVAGLALGWAWFSICAIAFGRRLLAPR